MTTAVRIAAILFAVFYSMAYTWWDRSAASFSGHAAFLAPMVAFAAIGVVPLRIAATSLPAKVIASAGILVASALVARDALRAWGAIIEPGTPDMAFRLVSLAILCAALVSIVRYRRSGH